MKLTVKRIFNNDKYSIGRLFIDGVYECDTLEDPVRDLNKDGDSNDAGEGKIWGNTAIPYGTYKVSITYSNRFKRELPLLLNVPHFEGIRIHPGNDAVDTHGCILVGKNTEKGKVTQSKITFDKLFSKLKKAEDIEITIA